MSVNHPSRCPIRRALVLAAVCVLLAAAQSPQAGTTIMAGAELPKAAAPVDIGLCRHHGAEPRTTAGRKIAGSGWAITDEEPLGALIAVSFVTGSRSMPSGACVLTGGRIGFFDGPNLMALAEGLHPGGTAIRHLRHVGDGRLRIWDGGMPNRPVADVPDGAPVIVPLPSADELCNGSPKMPLIHGLNLSDASVLLAEHGWEPDRLAEPSDPLAARLAERGFTGAEYCSGIGFGFCSLTFVQDGAAGSVLTFGDVERPAGPEVADYIMTCPDSPPQPG